MNDTTRVQSGTHGTADVNTVNIPVTLATPVDGLRSSIFITVAGGNDTSASSRDELNWTGMFANSTTLLLQRQVNAVGTPAYVSWYAVTWPRRTIRLRGLQIRLRGRQVRLGYNPMEGLKIA